MAGPAIGIDLGTTYSCVAVYNKKSDAGLTTVIPNEQGNKITPSYVAFTDTETLIGDVAKIQAALNPDNTIYDAKRLIGRSFSDPKLQEDIKIWPFKVINDNDKPKFKVQSKGRKCILWPEEISSMILFKMQQIAENHLGEEVKNAVITVPAYFNDSQRKATKVAGGLVGLNVLRIINEPTAAALAYGIQNGTKEKRNILVYDLGGGTFDVTILTLTKGLFKVIATTGNSQLGGGDFDNRMVSYCAEEFGKRYHNKNIYKVKRAKHRLQTACELAKRLLSFAQNANIDLELLMDGRDFRITITREQFEEMNKDLFQSTIDLVSRTLEEANMTKSDIDDILLVGGSTRIPKIQELLRNFFNGKALNKSINPDEVVACGAAIQAALLEEEVPKDLEQVALIDVTPLALGINTLGGVMTPVIECNTSLPAKETKTFSTAYDGQTYLHFEVYQGKALRSKECSLLGSFNLIDIPPAPAKKPKIDVTFELDHNGILKVTATDRYNNLTKNIVVVVSL